MEPYPWASSTDDEIIAWAERNLKPVCPRAYVPLNNITLFYTSDMAVIHFDRPGYPVERSLSAKP